MKVRDMADLIRIYDATAELTALFRKLCSPDGEGRNLSYVERARIILGHKKTELSTF